jgi:glyoxalase superfamily protein
MVVKFQIVIDCRDPARMIRFWASALGYEIEPVPKGFAGWEDYWRALGIPEDELASGPEHLIDPSGAGPRIWFQRVDEAKTLKNRIHFDIGVGGTRKDPLELRRRRVEAEAERLSGLGATRLRELFEEGIDHYAVAMLDPEGNEFDIN